MNEKISVIIPIYNAEKCLKRCIDSVVEQTYSNLEIILIDDGSTDRSYAICKEYEENDERIRVFQQQNSGVSVARNYGLKMITGKYVMFLDSDDYFELNICEKLLDNIKKYNSEIGIVNKKFWINDKEVYNILYKEDNFYREKEEKDLFLLDLFTQFYDKKMHDVKFLSCGVTAKIFLTELIRRNSIEFLEKCHFGEDVLFNLYAFQYAKKISYSNFNGYNFVVSDASSTHKYKEFWEESHNKFIDEIEIFVEKFKKDERFFEVATMMRVTRITGLMSIYYFHPNNPKKFKERYRDFKKMIDLPKYKMSLKNVNISLLTKKQKIIIYILKMKLGLFFTFFYNLNKGV